MMFIKSWILLLYLSVSTIFAQQADRIDLGKLQTGATVSFLRDLEGRWGMEIAGNIVPHLTQKKPARLEIFRMENKILELNSDTILSGNQIRVSMPMLK